MDKGVVEVEVDAMVMELEDSSRILDLEALVEDVLLLEERGDGGFCDEGELELMLMLLVMLGVQQQRSQEVETYYKAYAKQQGFGVVRAAWSGYKAKDSHIEENSGVKTSKKCECPMQIYAISKVVNEHQNHNPTHSKSRFITTHCKEEMNCHVKRKLKLGHSASLKVAQIHNMLARERNGLQEMAINGRDIRNELYREKKLKLKDGDAKAMLELVPGKGDVGPDIHKTFVLGRNVNHSTRRDTQHWLSLQRCIAEQWRREPRRKSNMMLIRCYTDMKFKEIQRECSRIMSYTFANKVWCLNKETKKEYLTQHKRNYRVRFDMISKLAECECSLFNHSGIICSHMIKLYDILGEEVPDIYILRRWTKDISRKNTRVKVAYHDPSKTEHVVSYDEMQLVFESIFSKALVFKDTKHLVLEFLELLDIRVDEKRVMIENEILNQTPSFVCLKDKQVRTPASATAKRKADCGIPTPESDKPPSSAGNEGNVKDPPRKAKPAH
ncbi:Protein FAR1-RELATED SEQUENCE 9 [Bienertia sinuspersici]